WSLTSTGRSPNWALGLVRSCAGRWTGQTPVVGISKCSSPPPRQPPSCVASVTSRDAGDGGPRRNPPTTPLGAARAGAIGGEGGAPRPAPCVGRTIPVCPRRSRGWGPLPHHRLEELIVKASKQGRAGLGSLAALALVVAAAAPVVAATDSVTLANGAELSVTVDPAGSNGTFLVPAGDTDVDVPMTGEASIGVGEPNVHWTYVIDVSGSTVLSCGGALGTILDCEKLAVGNLNSTVTADGSALDVGLTVFGESGASADMTVAAGDQPVTSPGDPGFGTVLSSVVIGSVGQFQLRNVGSDSTNYTAGLQAAQSSVN